MYIFVFTQQYQSYRIKKETEKEIETSYKDNLESLTGSGWPSTVKPCPDYNRGLGDDSCEIS